VPEDFQTAYEQISESFARVKRDPDFVLEAGCIGGHGRTGTILACWAVLDGMTAKDAIDYIRKNYCHDTIETITQEWWVEWFEAKLLGKDAPEQPYTKPKVATTGGTNLNSGQYCTVRSHWDMWKAGKVACVIRPTTCKMFKMDLDRFMAGQVTFKDGQMLTDGKAGYPQHVFIGDYKLPKPGPKEPVHAACATKRTGPDCDYCRYVALRPRGIGEAFLELSETAKKRLEDKEEVINVAGPNGEIIKVNTKATGSVTLNPKPGDTREGFVYVQGEGWVAEFVANDPQHQQPKRHGKRSKKEKRRARKQYWKDQLSELQSR
jgi:hypothetical protein